MKINSAFLTATKLRPTAPARRSENCVMNKSGSQEEGLSGEPLRPSEHERTESEVKATEVLLTEHFNKFSEM